jgi:aryl-alcohol dehydrogenase-like predicted oxidoreductase
VVHAALDRGITLIDTADAYNAGRSEEYLGEILGERRKRVVLATKFGMALQARGTIVGASRATIMQAVEASLTRLRTDWIDLYQVHRPDPNTPIEETLRALDDLVRQGKVRHIGCSNFSPRQVAEAQAAARNNRLASFIACQDQYSLLTREIERELVPQMKALGLSLLPYFPLASGLLSGKYRRDAMPEDGRLTYSRRHSDRFISERNWSMVESLDAFCARRGRTMLEVAFGWLLAQPIVASVIAGASTPEQVEQNIRAAACTLSAEELSELNRLTD